MIGLRPEQSSGHGRQSAAPEHITPPTFAYSRPIKMEISVSQQILTFSLGVSTGTISVIFHTTGADRNNGLFCCVLAIVGLQSLYYFLVRVLTPV